MQPVKDEAIEESSSVYYLAARETYLSVTVIHDREQFLDVGTVPLEISRSVSMAWKMNVTSERAFNNPNGGV